MWTIQTINELYGHSTVVWENILSFFFKMNLSLSRLYVGVDKLLGKLSNLKFWCPRFADQIIFLVQYMVHNSCFFFLEITKKWGREPINLAFQVLMVVFFSQSLRTSFLLIFSFHRSYKIRKCSCLACTLEHLRYKTSFFF